MTRNYLTVQMQEGGRYYAYVLPVSHDDNLVHVLARMKGIVCANIAVNKKQAEKTVNSWNDGFKQEGKYLFDF